MPFIALSVLFRLEMSLSFGETHGQYELKHYKLYKDRFKGCCTASDKTGVPNKQVAHFNLAITGLMETRIFFSA